MTPNHRDSTVNFPGLLAARICYSGGKLQVERARSMLTCQQTHGAEMKENRIKETKAAKAQNTEDAESIASATLISDSEYKDLRRKRDANEQESAQIKKYELVQVYGKPDMDAKFVEKYREPAVLERHRTFFQYAKAQHLQEEDSRWQRCSASSTCWRLPWRLHANSTRWKP